MAIKEKIIGEKKERFDIKTMRKDIARLRLIQAEKERERILKIQEHEQVPSGKKRTEQREQKKRQELKEIIQAIQTKKIDQPNIQDKQEKQNRSEKLEIPIPPPSYDNDKKKSQEPISEKEGSLIQSSSENKGLENKEKDEMPMPEKEKSPIKHLTLKELTMEQRLKQAQERIQALKTETEQKEEQEKTRQVQKEISTEMRIEKKERETKEKSSEQLQQEMGGPVKILSKFPPKPSSGQRYRNRTVIVILSITNLILVLGFLYWFLILKDKKIITPVDTTPPEKEEIIPETPEIIEPEHPLSFLPIEKEQIIEVSNLNEIPDKLDALISKKNDEKEFTRILIKDTKDPHFIGLKGFLYSFQIEAPEGLLDKLEDNFTLFLYSYNNKNSLGFISKVKENQDISETVISWQSTMEQDLGKLFLILGRNETESYSVFKMAKYKDTLIHYLSSPQKDFGICWFVIDDLFVFTSSGTGSLRTIDLLKL